jgi:hypothetical protein
MNRGGITIATSVARRGGSGSFAAGGGAASPINGRLGQGQTRPEAEAVVMMYGTKSVECWARAISPFRSFSREKENH